MSVLAHYAFLPFLRQGVGNQIADSDTLGGNDGTSYERPSLVVDLRVRETALDGGQHDTLISKTVHVVGPGDVTGINQRAIIQTEPKPFVDNFEDNGLAYIEFYEEDFLWRYTPASPDLNVQSGEQLRPWLALVVLKDEEHSFTPNPSGLPFISVKPDRFDAAFHHQADTWALAHVHLNQELAHTQGPDDVASEVSSLLGQNPDVGLCRLLCPRKLTKSTGYTAYLIPTFETGRLAGLGLPTAEVLAQLPAWRKGAMPHSTQRPFDYPVYYQWTFRTGALGDFETLAAILKPVITPKSSATRPLAIQSPGFGLDGAAGSATVGFEGALQPTNFESPAWPVTAKDKAFQDQLQIILNLSADLVSGNAVVAGPHPFYAGTVGNDPIVVPPIYGIWHVNAQVQRLGPGHPAWLQDLNLDPRWRGVAGLGTQVIQANQEEFVNQAWQQIDQVNEANKRIREAELARQVSEALHKKHLVTASLDHLVMMTGTVHALLLSDQSNLGSKQTVEQDFRASRIPDAARLPAFRKLIRPNPKTTPKITAPTAPLGLARQVITRFNADGAHPLTTAPLKRATAGTLTVGQVAGALTTATESYKNDKTAISKDLLVTLLEEHKAAFTFAGNEADLPAARALLAQALAAKAPVADVQALTQGALDGIVRISCTDADQSQLTILLQATEFEKLFKKDGHDVKVYGSVILQRQGTENTPDAQLKVGALTMQSQVLAFQQRFATFGAAKAKLPQPTLPAPLAKLNLMPNLLRSQLKPEFTLAERLLSTLKIWQNGVFVPLPKLEPVMAYPEFQEPMYTYLLKLSKDYLIPNIDKLPKNSITLLETNQSFIEAFMVGLNHEMARELLWREYPTDRRGSYFRQFWNTHDNLLEPDPAKKLAVTELPTWQGHLGTHSPSGKNATLVLVVRGELLVKYPDTLVYAQQARYNPDDPRKPRLLPADAESLNPQNTKFPLFRAEIQPDITLLGFDLTDVEAHGERITAANQSAAGKNPGWFFIFKERPGHIRFGLDESVNELGDRVMPTGNPATWNDLTWEHLVSKEDDLATYHLTFGKPLATTQPSDYAWHRNSADLAAILYQNPVIFARHAGEMMPSSLT